MTIHVLMVTDAEGSYVDQGMRFGLTELVEALEGGGCVVTKAHRWNAGMEYTQGADLTGFKFVNASVLAGVDVVWLIGFASNNAAGPYHDPAGFEMSANEVEVLAQFMEDGGGVFATGDHDDLGADLCAKVPRVRGMRRWAADYGWLNHLNDPENFVPDPTKSPPPIGRFRLDTLEAGPNAHFEFQDQSDDVPQRIEPVMRVVREHISHVAGGEVGFRESVPHPLLCGPDGVVDVLPDHMHEGRCLVPPDLTTTFAIGRQQREEYPPTAFGARISPEVVAWARVRARQKDPNFDDPTEDVRDSNTDVSADRFPVIVAYNGHRAGVGRVAVDATFHHFVNINVTGVKPDFQFEPDPLNPVDALGFLASPQGQAHYAKIKAYWVNIARWLAPPSTTIEVVWPHFARVALDPRVKQTALGDLVRSPDTYLVRHGASAWGSLTESLSPCSVLTFIFDIAIPDPLSYLLSHEVYVKLTLPDPPPEEVLRLDLAVDKLELAYFALGAAVTELRAPEHRMRMLSGDMDAPEGVRVLRAGALRGLQRGMKQQASRMQRTVRALETTIDYAERALSDLGEAKGATGS